MMDAFVIVGGYFILGLVVGIGIGHAIGVKQGVKK